MMHFGECPFLDLTNKKKLCLKNHIDLEQLFTNNSLATTKFLHGNL